MVDGCGIHLQHDLQSFVVPNVGPNVTTGNVGSTVSPVNVATLDVAGPWERTLENSTALIFGKFIDVQQIPNSDFPEHYFNFAAYNELAARADVRNAILTDYIGRIQVVSGIHTSEDVTTNRTRWRIIDIQNISGNTISLALWHEMAVNFNVREYEAMEKPVVIALGKVGGRRDTLIVMKVGDGCGIRLQHDLQSFGVPNVGPNVMTGNVGSTVSPINVATLDVA
nr:nucleic acid-binding, OB-fold protein [Tanacetum cinerariifolium]